MTWQFSTSHNNTHSTSQSVCKQALWLVDQNCTKIWLAIKSADLQTRPVIGPINHVFSEWRVNWNQPNFPLHTRPGQAEWDPGQIRSKWLYCIKVYCVSIVGKQVTTYFKTSLSPFQLNPNNQTENLHISESKARKKSDFVGNYIITLVITRTKHKQ